MSDFSEKLNKAELEKKKWNSQWQKLNFALVLLVFSGFGHLAEGGYIKISILGNLFFME